MSQSVTITRSGGEAVTVEIDADDGNARNISDAEARAAFDAAQEQGLSASDLEGGTMTIGEESLESDRYRTLLGGGGSASAPTPEPAPAAPSVLRFSRAQLHLDVPGLVYGGNGVEGGVGATVGLNYVTPVSEDGRTTLRVGGGLTYQYGIMNPSGVSLTQGDLDTGATGRDFTGRHLLFPHLELSIMHRVDPALAIGGLLRVGPAFLLGDDVTHRLSGPDYMTAYCPGDGTGIFGDDVTSCENRPGGAHTERDSNDSTASGMQAYFRALVGPALAYSLSDRFDLFGSVGLDVLVGDQSRAGGYGLFGVRIGLDEPTPAGPTPAAPEAETIDATSDVITPTVDANGHTEISLTDDEIRDLANLPAGATIRGVRLDDGAEDTSAPYEFEAAPGDHTLTVRYTEPGDSTERTRVVRIRVGEASVEVPETSTGSAYGIVPNLPRTATRPALVAGVPAGPIPVGSIETTSEVPANSTYQLYVDGNPVGDPEPLPADRNTPMTIPATVTDGEHTIGVRIQRPGMAELRFRERPITIGPATSLGEPAPAMGAPSYSSRSRDAATVVIHTTRAVPSGVTISVNGRPMAPAEFNGALAEGVNTITLRNPDMRMNNNVRGVRAGTYPVVINIPGEDPITLQLVITRPRGGGGGGGGGVPSLR